AARGGVAVEGDLRDRAARRRLQAHGRPRRLRRGQHRRHDGLARLAEDPLRPEDAARDRRDDAARGGRPDRRADAARRPVMIRAEPVTAAAAAGTLALAAVAWAIALREMSGMDMGTATELGSPGAFAAAWVPMMAAMMLPGAVPAVVRRARAGGVATAVFAAAYVAVWAAAGAAVYLLDHPHGHRAAAVLLVAAGLYELTPFK